MSRETGNSPGRAAGTVPPRLAATARPAALRPAFRPPLLPQDAPLGPPRPRPSAGPPQAGCRRLRARRARGAPTGSGQPRSSQASAARRGLPPPSAPTPFVVTSSHGNGAARLPPPFRDPAPRWLRPKPSPPYVGSGSRKTCQQSPPSHAPPKAPSRPKLRPAAALPWSTPAEPPPQDPSLSIPVNTQDVPQVEFRYSLRQCGFETSSYVAQAT